MYIHGASAFITEPGTPPQVLKEELARVSKAYFRRVNRYILLSLIGAHRCVAGRAVPADTAVYLTTERGNLGETESVLRQIFRQHSLPMPYNFINTMSNTASFYIAQGLGAAGPNLSISDRLLSFERGISLMTVDFLRGRVRSALLGGVDEANPSTVHFERTYGIPAGSVRGVEGSAWLWVTDEPEGALGRILGTGSVRDAGAGAAWLKERTGRSPVIGYGLSVPAADREAWIRAVGAVDEFDYLSAHGWFDSATALGISRFVQECPGRLLLHVTCDRPGRYTLAAVETAGR
ncbi:MAG TPA: hypothetical protein PLO63_02775 [Syntrophales bacterium]|jgi:hypothetical protein|nr:hypothetical protein [Syntrophales bacterium]